MLKLFYPKFSAIILLSLEIIFDVKSRMVLRFCNQTCEVYHTINNHSIKRKKIPLNLVVFAPFNCGFYTFKFKNFRNNCVKLYSDSLIFKWPSFDFEKQIVSWNLSFIFQLLIFSDIAIQIKVIPCVQNMLSRISRRRKSSYDRSIERKWWWAGWSVWWNMHSCGKLNIALSLLVEVLSIFWLYF